MHGLSRQHEELQAPGHHAYPPKTRLSARKQRRGPSDLVDGSQAVDSHVAEHYEAEPSDYPGHFSSVDQNVSSPFDYACAQDAQAYSNAPNQGDAVAQAPPPTEGGEAWATVEHEPVCSQQTWDQCSRTLRQPSSPAAGQSNGEASAQQQPLQRWVYEQPEGEDDVSYQPFDAPPPHQDQPTLVEDGYPRVPSKVDFFGLGAWAEKFEPA